MNLQDLFESPQLCPECGGPAFSDLLLAEKKDACYAKVRSRYKVWPSAYASGALVQCRKKGAANWGNKSESVAEGSQQTTFTNEELDAINQYLDDNLSFQALRTYPGLIRKIASHLDITSVQGHSGEMDFYDRLIQAREQGDIPKPDMAEGSVTKKPQPYNDPNWTKKLTKDQLDALAGPRYNTDKKKQGEDVWGPQGRFAGDVKTDVGGVSMKKMQPGDTVRYFGARAEVLELNSAKNYARITVNGKTLSVRLSDLRPLGQGVAEGSDIPQWRVEQSDATGRYYVVSGYSDKSRKVWKSKLGAIDFVEKADAEAKAQELNQGVAESLNEMDKTQTSPGRDGDIDWTKKQIHLGPEHVIKAKDVAKHALKALDKTMKKSHADTSKKKGVAEAFGPLPQDNQQIRLGRHTVDIERVGLNKNYIGFTWHDSKGQEHYEEVPVGDLGSYDDLVDRIKQEISYQERKYTDQGVAEMRNTDDPMDDMIEDYLDYLESVDMLNKSREEEKAQLIADLESGITHSSEIGYALSGTKWDPLKQGVAEGSEWETRHDEFVTVGDRATPEQINKIVSALDVAAKQVIGKRGFLNQVFGKQSNGDLARMAHGAETLAKNIQRNRNAKPGTDERKELGQHLVYAVSLLKRISGKQGVAEGSQEDAKFTPRFEVRSRIESALDQYLDPEQVAGGHTDIQYYKHDGRVYVEVLFNYTNGQKIGPTQRKRFLVNKDFTLTPIKRQQGVAEGSLNEFAPDGFNGGGDNSNDLQLYLDVAKKLNMKKYKPSTAHALIAKKMAELVDVVDDDKVDYARHMARKAQGLSNMLEQGVAEGDEEKIGGRYDPDEFDAMIGRLKKLAGAGPLKTVWDPQKRVYRNVPVAQQPDKK